MKTSITAALTCALLCLYSVPALAGLQAGVVSPNLKVRPNDKPTLSPSAKLRAGRNEFEAFQIVLLSSGGATSGVSVQLAGALSAAGGASIPTKNVTIYAERYYEAKSASDREGGTGLWPDPLVPDVDVYVGEKRNAFPLDVPDGQTRVVWVDVLVPADATPGTYSGTLQVTASGSAAGQIQLSLEVGSFSLPSTASFASAFRMGWSDPCQAHYGNNTCGPDWNPDRAGAVHERYLRMALDHRLTIATSEYQPPFGDGLASYEKYTLPLINGTGPTRLVGAKMTAVMYDAQASEWIAYAKSKGFFERMMYFPVDEPSEDSDLWQDFISASNALHKIDANARVIVTASMQESNTSNASSYVDLFCPVINQLDDKRDAYQGDQTGKYKSWLAGKSNRQLWSYQSCESHGCGECGDTTTEPYYDGWPQLVIDSSALQDRCFPWLGFHYGFVGELYFNTTEQLSTAWDSNGQCKYGGHGDGTLFYPGNPSLIGGSTHIPVESIRLKMIREGREDYEYLVLAAKRDAAKTKAIADALFPNAYSCNQTPEKFEQARNQLFDLLNSAGPGGDGGVTGDGGALSSRDSGDGCGCRLVAAGEAGATGTLLLMLVALHILLRRRSPLFSKDRAAKSTEENHGSRELR